MARLVWARGLTELPVWATCCSSCLCLTIARHGSLEALQWAHANGFTWDVRTYEEAAKNGHLPALKWALWGDYGAINSVIIDQRYSLRQRIGSASLTTCVEGAASGGHLHIIEWLFSQWRLLGSDWLKRTLSANTCSLAARGGHLAVLHWLRTNAWPNAGMPCDWDANTCRRAAEGGFLEVLQWARENGAEWDDRTCFEAAKNNHLGVLQWARANGCPWNRVLCTIACQEYPSPSQCLAWISQQPD